MATRLRRLIDLSHVVEDGMLTYPGLPAPQICDFWTREQSQAHYAPGTTFHIGQIEMVANTGTYVDAPFHRFADGVDLAGLALESLADLDTVVVRPDLTRTRAIDAAAFKGLNVQGKAALVHTDWSRHWRTPQYGDGHPYLTADAARWLADQGAVLVGIDSLNIDDITNGGRPVHTTLLRAGIPIAEHLTNLAELPNRDFRFHAVPVKVAGMGTFPVRAYAVIS
ncbi:MAG: cyclase family protein [Anaerolineae bacterium]|nr:cyclase family protein [Anaerolineae bacterium]